MPIIIGTDEAGYGPNLGPLVVAASAWRVPGELGVCDFYELLADSVCRQADASRRIPIADSKRLYKPGGTLANLERAVFTALSAREVRPDRWRTIWPALCANMEDKIDATQWYADYDEPAPLDCVPDDIAATLARFCANCQDKSVEFLGLRAAAVCPNEFNRRVRQLGSKGSLLTETTLRLAAAMIEQHPGEQTFVLCDKHGGRNRYAAALQHVWPESWITVLYEGRAESAYRLNVEGGEVEFRFSVGGESQLSSALASMTAKYLRELAMRAFNAFWKRHVPKLRPTAGYPVDARRFKDDISAAQQKLNIADDILWRCR